MITEKLEKAFNDQITAELWSSNLYLQMSFYLQKEGWDGCAHWMLKQSEEERDHAVELAGYLAKRGGTAKVSMVDVVPDGWGSVEEVFKHVYETVGDHVLRLLHIIEIYVGKQDISLFLVVQRKQGIQCKTSVFHIIT